MKLSLYHYVHCPFCVRVRMALGYLNLSFNSVVLPYNDEKTPVDLTGSKMLPIMEIDGKAMNESLDIISAIDTGNLLRVPELKASPELESFNKILNKLGTNVHNLAMPYWIWTPEFDQASRQYFMAKKEVKRGPFKELVKRKDQFISEISEELTNLSQDLKPFYRSEQLTIYDILLASHVWGLYVVPEFQFPDKFHSYLQNVKQICHFDYHKDFWN